MRYYAYYDGSRLLSFGSTSCEGIVLDHELTEAEYNVLLEEFAAKASLEDKLYNGEITEADIPAEYRDEIVRRVAERREAEAQHEEDEASTEELARALEEIL